MPNTPYNIFTLSTDSVVGISTTATVGTSTSSVITLTTTSNVGLTTTSVVGLTTTSVVGLTTTSSVGINVVGPTSSNVLTNTIGFTTTTVATTVITIPPGRTWQGTVAISAIAANLGAATTGGLAKAQITTSGGGAVPSSIFWQVQAVAGENVAGGTVGTQGSNFGAIPMTIIATSSNTLLQASATITGSTRGAVDVVASGILLSTS